MGGSFGGTIGRIGLGAVGFGLGAMVGMPALGASLGMSIGGMLFAPKQSKKTRHISSVLGSSSVEGTPLAIIFGRVRVGGTLLWKGAIVYHEIKKKKGKGGGSGSVVTDQWYTISFAMVIGEGTMSLQRIYEGKNIVNPAYTFYEGTETQLADGFLTSETGKSIPYKHTAYIVFQNYRVGMTAQIPQLTFEVVSGQSKFDVSLTLTDYWGVTRTTTKYNYVTVADLQNCITPAYAIKELIKNDRYGGGFKKNTNWLDAHTDCVDKSYFFNLAITERRDLASLIEMISSHGWIINVFSGSDIRLLLAKSTTPTKSYFLDDMAGKEHESVIDVSESGRSERYNRVSVEYTDPLKEYSTRPIQIEDLADQQDRGVIKQTISLPGFTDPDVAKEVGSVSMRNSLFGRRMAQFTLGPSELETEIGDVCYVSAPSVGLTLTRMRIFGVDETEEFNLAITAREEPNYIFDPTNFEVPASFATPAVDTNVGLSNAVGFNMHEVPKELLLNAGAVEIMPVYRRQHKETVGMNIYYSLDDQEFILLHEDRHPALGGILGHTQEKDSFLNADKKGLLVDTAFGEPNTGGDTLESMSRATLMSTKNMGLIDDELMLYQNSSLGTTQLYTLTDFVRGRYNTEVLPHASGSDYFHLDDGERIEFLKTQIGVKYYFKAVPFNTYNYELDISEVTSIGMTVGGWAFRPYPPGCIWQEEDGIRARGRTYTKETDITIAWNNCSKNIGFGQFPYNTRDYGDYFGDGDLTEATIDIYGLNDISSLTTSNTLNVFFTGADDSTDFFDLSDNGHVLTSGGAVVDTAQFKFGTSSGYFNDSTRITAPDHSDWTLFSSTNTSFTVDMWVRFETVQSDQVFIGQDEGTSFFWFFGLTGGYLYMRSFYSPSNKLNVKAAWSPVADTWYHIAFVRNVSTRYIFIDGISQALPTNNNIAMPNLNSLLNIGGLGPSGWGAWFHNGWIDELRVSKGEALWTTNFVPPTSSNLATVDSGFIKTVSAGTTQSYTYTEADNIADNGGFQTGLEFKVNNKSIYGSASRTTDKTIQIIQ